MENMKKLKNKTRVPKQVYASFVVPSVLSLVGNVNTRRMSHKKSMKYSGHRKLLCELSKFSKFNAFILLGYFKNTDASILVYKFRPKRTMVSKCTQSIRDFN